MSVTKNFRSISKLKVVVDAIELCSYTMDTCGKEDNFPKRSRWMLAEKIVNLSQEIVDHIIKGNEIIVECSDDFMKRRGHQRDAYGACESLLTFITIAYVKYQLADNTIEFWTKSVVQLEAMIAKWRRRDLKTYQEFVPDGFCKDEVDFYGEQLAEEDVDDSDLPF